MPGRGGGMLTEGGAGEAALLRGVVWVQRERLFARWATSVEVEEIVSHHLAVLGGKRGSAS